MHATYNHDGHIWLYSDNQLVRLTHILQAEAARKAGAVDLGNVDGSVVELFRVLADPERVVIIGDRSALDNR